MPYNGAQNMEQCNWDVEWGGPLGNYTYNHIVE